MSDDPFQQAQADIVSLLGQTRPLLQSYLRIRSSASSPSSPELVEARQELESTLTDLSTDLQDLVDSVRAVEGDPYRYGLDVAEVARRRKLVEDVGREVENMHNQLNEVVVAADARKAGKANGLANPDTFEDMEDDDDYGAWEEQRQMEIMHEQDEALDGVFQTVGNLRAQADTMGRELEEQAELLEDTENITDRVGGKLQAGMKKIRYVIEKNEDTYSSCCIIGLVLVLIVLLILVISFHLWRCRSSSSKPGNSSKQSEPFIPAPRYIYNSNMNGDRSHPLLQQTPLSVNPFIDLPKAPTLPHNYASLPSTLPPSTLNSIPAPSNPDLPGYVTSSSGFAAHPKTIIAQNKSLLEQLETQRKDAERQVQEWEQSIGETELAEKRRKAPGWLDTEDRILQPEKPKAEMGEADNSNLMDELPPKAEVDGITRKSKDVDDLGAAMDRAFGRSEMG